MRYFSLFFLITLVLISCKTQPQTFEEPTLEVEIIRIVEPEAIEIEIIEPVFEIVSILILQADIVVTEFEATLRVTNPNDFAVVLSSITYQLYGNGLYWADGKADDILYIPAQSSDETSFIFQMNFINMSRALLDDVIAMRQIHYHFRGQAHMQPDIPNTSAFIVNFDISGLSEVRRRAH